MVSFPPATPGPWKPDLRKLILQIPCFNEASTLGVTLAALPRTLPGVECVEWLVIDDGSTDGTADVARAAGVDHIIRFPRNRGLARAFMAGLDAALAAGADVIVNTDADNQYDARDIPALVAPILEGRAEFVIGERPIASIAHFSGTKKVLQRLGSAVVRWVSGVDVPDAPSGFRALTRDAALQLHLFTNYTYTLETLIQAGQAGIVTTSVPVRVNGYLRPSRLIRSQAAYIWRSALTIAQVLVIYRPLRFFGVLAGAAALPAVALGIRYLYFMQAGEGKGHVQSVLLAVMLTVVAVGFSVLGVLAELIASNRRLLEDVRTRVRRVENGDHGG